MCNYGKTIIMVIKTDEKSISVGNIIKNTSNPV